MSGMSRQVTICLRGVNGVQVLIFETSIRSYNMRSNRNFSFFLTGFLPKHHAQAGRVSLYKSSLYYAAFPDTSEGVEDSSRFEQKEEEDSGVRREPRHHSQWCA